jgi:hypothetical protein
VAKDWVEWHSDYDDPESALSERRRQVTMLISKSLDCATSGHVRILSLCSGDARDLADALRRHERRRDVSCVLVELDPQLASSARSNLESTDVDFKVVVGDAGDVATFRDVLPIDLLLLVGIFGNVPDSDVETTIRAVPCICREGATAIWTRHRRPPDLTPSVRRWFDAVGCRSLDFVSPGEGQFAIGRERVLRSVPAEQRGTRLFRFHD